MKSKARSESSWKLAESALAVLLIGLVMLSLGVGAYPVSASKICGIGWALITQSGAPHPGWTDTDQVVVQVIRLPRTLLAAMSGAGLALSGACLQGVMRNPLVAPDIIGVTAGAVCGGVFAILLDASAIGVVIAALAGGLFCLLLATALARLSGGGILAFVLSGIVVGAFFSALVALALLMSDPNGSLQRILFWTLGSFSGADRVKVVTLGGPVLLAGGVLLGLRWRFQSPVTREDEDAAALGLKAQSPQMAGGRARFGHRRRASRGERRNRLDLAWSCPTPVACW